MGLPSFKLYKIDRNNLLEASDLFKNKRTLEHLVKKKHSEKTVNGSENQVNIKSKQEQPCKIWKEKTKIYVLLRSLILIQTQN